MIPNNPLGLLQHGATLHSTKRSAGIRRHGSGTLIGEPADAAGDVCSAANLLEFMQRGGGATADSNDESITLEISECIGADMLFGEPFEHWRSAAGLDDILVLSQVGGDDR